MQTLKSLQQLQKTSSSMHSLLFPTEEGAGHIQKQIQNLTEMTFVYVLNLMAEENEQKLGEIVTNLPQDSDFYGFTVLAYQLSKTETDFDFLTAPENLSVYERIAELSEECKFSFPYINILIKISNNKLYGLYSENQEVHFFLDEYEKYKGNVSPSDFLHQFRKILKYRTQQVFTRFIEDDIFSLIPKTLAAYSARIESELGLSLYVYELQYYESDISNDDEVFLIEHIGFCISYLARHGSLEFKPSREKSFFPSFRDDIQAAEWFFEHNESVLDSLDRFIGLFKDVCSSSENVNELCDFLRANVGKKNAEVFDEDKNEFSKFISKTIKEKFKSNKHPLYKEICKLLPQIFICMRHPAVSHHDGYGTDDFYDLYEAEKVNDESGKGKRTNNLIVSALMKGCKNKGVLEANIAVKVEILARDKNGYAISWDWKPLKHTYK